MTRRDNEPLSREDLHDFLRALPVAALILVALWAFCVVMIAVAS